MATLRNAIKSFDPAPEKQKEMELALSLAFELAQAKCEQFKEDIAELLRTAGTPENPTIPVTNTIASHYDTRAYVNENVDRIIEETQDAIEKFITGGSQNILDGIGSLLGTGINTLLGSGMGVQGQREDYFIALEGFAIVRLDVKSWFRKVEVEGITQKIESIMAFTAVKSSVDVSKISLNTFLQAYSYQLQKSKISELELLEAIKQAKEVYDLLKGSNKAYSLDAKLADVSKYPAADIGY